MFSLPDISDWNPMLRERMLATLPSTSTVPESGSMIFAIMLSNVLLPLPFLPRIPSISPFLTERLMPFKTLFST